jgi:hypothetical protein
MELFCNKQVIDGSHHEWSHWIATKAPQNEEGQDASKLVLVAITARLRAAQQQLTTGFVSQRERAEHTDNSCSLAFSNACV